MGFETVVTSWSIFFVVGGQQVGQGDGILAIGVFVDRVGRGGDVDADGVVEGIRPETVDPRAAFCSPRCGGDVVRSRDRQPDPPPRGKLLDGLRPPCLRHASSKAGVNRRFACWRTRRPRGRVWVAEGLILVGLGEFIGAGPAFSELGDLALGPFEGG